MDYMGFANLVPFPAQQVLLADETGVDLLTLIAKATYRIEGQNRLVLDDEQPAIDPAGEYYGDPQNTGEIRA